MVNSLEDFKKLIDVSGRRRGDLSREIRNQKLLYVVTYPDKLKWDHGVYRQTQMTYMQMGGGPTGAGSNHNIVLCKESELSRILNDAKQSTHAMICSVGMIFVVTEVHEGIAKTSLSSFLEFVESKEYCRGHIIAHENIPAYLHHQHIELNLEMWRMIGRPDPFEKWHAYIRSPENFHDDYTPPWIKPRGLPRIKNFNKEERNLKAFAYPNNRHKIQNDTWSLIEHDRFSFRGSQHNEPYFSKLKLNFNDGVNFYVENNEVLAFEKEMLNYKFELLISPCAGYSTEIYSKKLNFEGEVVFYDWHKSILQLKEKIVELNMDKDEIEMLGRVYSDVFLIWNHEYRQQERFEKYGTWEEIRQIQKEMNDKHVVTYNEWDLLNMDYNILAEKVKGKNVFINTSNIFSYHKVLTKYPLDVIWNSFEQFIGALNNANFWYLVGSYPTKKRLKGAKGVI